MADKVGKEFLTVDDLHLLMQGYKNTVELSNSVLKQQEDIIRCVKDINDNINDLKDVVYETSGKTIEKVEASTVRGIDKLENISSGFKKDIADQNEKLIINKEEIVGKVSKAHTAILLGVLGLVGTIGSLLAYMYSFVHEHGEIMTVLKAIAQKLNIIIQ